MLQASQLAQKELGRGDDEAVGNSEQGSLCEGPSSEFGEHDSPFRVKVKAREMLSANELEVDLAR